MSACISRSGEFSEHSLDESHTCTRCHVLDEEKLRAELARYAERLDRLRPVVETVKAWRELLRYPPSGKRPLAPILRAEAAIIDALDALEAAEPSGEAGLDPNAPPIEAVLHALGDVIAPDEPTGRTRCPLCKTLPIGHEGECEP